MLVAYKFVKNGNLVGLLDFAPFILFMHALAVEWLFQRLILVETFHLIS